MIGSRHFLPRTRGRRAIDEQRLRPESAIIKRVMRSPFGLKQFRLNVIRIVIRVLLICLVGLVGQSIVPSFGKRALADPPTSEELTRMGESVAILLQGHLFLEAQRGGPRDAATQPSGHDCASRIEAILERLRLGPRANTYDQNTRLMQIGLGAFAGLFMVALPAVRALFPADDPTNWINAIAFTTAAASGMGLLTRRSPELTAIAEAQARSNLAHFFAPLARFGTEFARAASNPTTQNILAALRLLRSRIADLRNNLRPQARETEQRFDIRRPQTQQGNRLRPPRSRNASNSARPLTGVRVDATGENCGVSAEALESAVQDTAEAAQSDPERLRNTNRAAVAVLDSLDRALGSALQWVERADQRSQDLPCLGEQSSFPQVSWLEAQSQDLMRRESLRTGEVNCSATQIGAYAAFAYNTPALGAVEAAGLRFLAENVDTVAVVGGTAIVVIVAPELAPFAATAATRIAQFRAGSVIYINGLRYVLRPLTGAAAAMLASGPRLAHAQEVPANIPSIRIIPVIENNATVGACRTTEAQLRQVRLRLNPL